MKTLPLLLALLAINPVYAGNKEDRARIAALEAKVAELEAKLDEVAKTQAPPTAAQRAEMDQEAMNLLKDATQAQQEGDTETAKRLYTRVVEEHAGSRAAGAASRMLAELNVVGTSVSTLEVTEWYQGETSLADHKATLVVFWEVWCPHCKREVPKLQATFETWGPKGLGVIGLTKLTRNKTEADVRAFIDEQSLGYPIGREDGSMSALFGVNGVPASAVIRDGVVVWRGHPAQITDDMLASWVE